MKWKVSETALTGLPGDDLTDGLSAAKDAGFLGVLHQRIQSG